jgi:hypothetical protein
MGHVSPGPPFDPGRSDFPSPVLTLAFPWGPSRRGGGLSADPHTPLSTAVYLQARPHYVDRVPPTLSPRLVQEPPSAQSPFARQQVLPPPWECPALPQRALPLLPRSYGLMRQSKSLPPTSGCAPIGSGLCRLLSVPAGRWTFPTLSLRIFPWLPGPVPRRLTWCTCPFLPTRHRPSPTRASGSAFRIIHTKQLPCGAHFGDVTIRYSFKPPGLLAILTAPTLTALCPPCGDGFYIRAEHASLPSRASDMLVVRTGQLTT